MIKAIETRYAGHRFRSRLEARWAVAFDHLGITWEYEPEGFQTSAGMYLPDFRVQPKNVRHFSDPDESQCQDCADAPGTSGNVYLEVKGGPLSQYDAERIRAFACDPGEPRWIIALGPIPTPHQDGPLFLEGWGQGQPMSWTLEKGKIAAFAGPYSRFHGPTRSDWMDRAFRADRGVTCWETCSRHFAGTAPCGCPCTCLAVPTNQALAAARSARFEHGERG